MSRGEVAAPLIAGMFAPQPGIAITIVAVANGSPQPWIIVGLVLIYVLSVGTLMLFPKWWYRRLRRRGSTA